MRIGIHTFLFAIIALVACSNQVAGFPPPCSDKSSLTLANGWPAWCASQLIRSQWGDQCLYPENASPISPISSIWRPSVGRVGSGVRFLFPQPLTKPVPVAYLGPSAESYGSPIWMHFLYGRAITPAELSFDPSLNKYISKPVWGLPLEGEHVYRLSGKQIEVQVKLPASGDGCQYVQDITVVEKDLFSAKVSDHSKLFSVEYSGIREPLRWNERSLRLLYADSFTTTTFLYVSWSKDIYPSPLTTPNWAFISLSDDEEQWAYKGKRIVFRVPIHEDVGIVWGNTLCEGLKSYQILSNMPWPDRDMPALEEYDYMELFGPLFIREPTQGGDLIRYDELGINLSCSMINVEWNY